jgi:hypothetical protein
MDNNNKVISYFDHDAFFLSPNDTTDRISNYLLSAEIQEGTAIIKKDNGTWVLEF